MAEIGWRALALAATALLALVACGGGGTGESLAAKQTLRFPLLDDFGTLDPGLTEAETDQEIAQNLFNGLYQFDQNLNIVPAIAGGMPTVSPDGRTYTFKLRHDVAFSNGDRVTAKDVLYSWNRGAALQGQYAQNFAPVVGWGSLSKKPPPQPVLEQLLARRDPSVTMSGLSAPDGPDGYTVQAQLTQPAGWWLSAITLSGTTGMIVDDKAIQTDPMNWWTRPATLVGAGPYKMVARTPGQSADFAAVPNWWGSPKPTVQRVHLDIIRDPSTAIAAFEQGRYDVYGYGGYSNAPVADVLRIKNTPSESSQLLLHPKSRGYWASFNVTADGVRQGKGPFTTDQPGSRELRLAFDLAVDKQKLVDVVCHSLVCTPMTGGIFPKGLAGYLGDNADPLAKFDPAQARQLLHKADPTGTRTTGLTYVFDPENPLNKAGAQFLQDQWQTNLGVHVDLRPEAHSQFIKDRLAGDFVLSRDGWQADYNSPEDWFDGMYTGAAGCPDSNCSSGYDDPQFNALGKKADTLPLQQALPYYLEMSRMLSSDVAYVPMFYSVGAFLIKPYVKGAGSNTQFDYYWSSIRILQH